jgi:hypothetical protein
MPGASAHGPPADTRRARQYRMEISLKRFAFRMSEKDRSYITELGLGGVDITVDIDPSQGGIFMVHEDASLTWTWLGDIDFCDGSDDEVDESDLETYTDAGEAIAAALLAARHQPSRATAKTSPSVELEVSPQDFQRLQALRQGGYEIYLSLDSDMGGIDAAHSSGACLKWYFITEIELDVETDSSDDDRQLTPPARDGMEVDMRSRFASLVMIAALK